MTSQNNKYNELNALIRLLDDPDEKVYYLIKKRILSYGTDAIAFLEGAWENENSEIAQYRIEDIIHILYFDSLKIQFEDWVKYGSDNLLLGALLVSRYQYPDLKEEDIIREMGKISQDIWLELNENLNALEKIRAFNQIFFHKHNFTGNKANYHSPENSFIKQVIETRKGNPISLSVIYMLIGRRLNLPIFGINLPEHFVLGYVENNKVLFYINSFSKGTILTKRELEFFIRQMKIEPDASYFEPCSNVDIIKRMLVNLSNAYSKQNQKEKVKEIEELIEIIDSGN